MQQLSNGQRLQLAYRKYLAPYSNYVQFAVTLTLKQSALIRVRRFENYGDDYFEFKACLDEEKLRGDIRYFTKQLTNEIYATKQNTKTSKHGHSHL